ncbi:hypothetical protein GCM10020369_22150 [Cryptosporangium minutisporangium]|uniref:Protein kinase domain-containing protein n=1 Tax=Cryptosporangium minutisporangium TaxID=113569 RepID=A0ABP6SV65_9ACTN
MLSRTAERDVVGGDRFLAEAQLLAELDHPHIVRLHDYVEHDGLCLLVMERLSGGSLGARGLRRVTPEYACALGLAVADALEAAHRRRVLHRDVKPDNLLFGGDGIVKVTDFGIAKLLDRTATTSSGFVGSPVYMAPEQASLGHLGPGTDLYSLSVVLYGLLTGRPLFSVDLPPAAMLLQHLSQPPPPMPDVATRVAAVVLRGLAKDLDDRQPTARAYALDLATAAAATFGADWLSRAGLPVRIDDELRDVARSTGPGRGGVVRPFETTVGRHLPDWPWGLPPARIDEVLRDGPTSDVTAPPAHADPSSSEPADAALSGAVTARLRYPRLPAARNRPALPPARSAEIRAGPDLMTTGEPRSGVRVVPATPRWLLGRPTGCLRPGRPGAPGRALAIGAAVLGAALVAVVVGLGVSRFAARPVVVPGPGGVATVGATVYVSDPARSQVRRFDARSVHRSGGVVVAGTGREGFSGDGGPAVRATLSNPGPLAVDGAGNLYIADLGNRRVRKVTPTGRISTVAGGGTRPVNGRTLGTRVRLSEPFSIAVSWHGVLWITEQQRNQISRVRNDGMIETFAGTGQRGFGGDGLYASRALLNAPTAVAVDTAGLRLYVADQGNRRIRVIRVGSGFIRTFAGDGSPGPLRNNVQATDVGLESVFTLATARDGNVYLGGSDVRRIDPDGFVRPVAELRTVSMAVTDRGEVYLVTDERTASGDRVHRFYRRTPAGRMSSLPW